MGVEFTAKIKDLKGHIDKLPKPIKKFLLYHLNENATQQSELFCKHYPFDRNFNEKAYKSPLVLAYTFLPTTASKELTTLLLELPQASRVNLLLNNVNKDEYLLKAILFNAPITCRRRICESLKSNSSYDLSLLFFGVSSPFFQMEFDYFSELLNNKDKITSALLIEAFVKIDKKQLKKFFNNIKIDKIIEQVPTESAALALLNALDFADDKIVKEQFERKDSDGIGFFYGNLVHQCFALQSEVVVIKLFTLLKRLDKASQKKVLTQSASYELDSGSFFSTYYSPLEIIFRYYPSISSAVIKQLRKNPSLLPLLSIRASYSTAESPLHVATRQHNTQAIITYLEHPDTHLDYPSASSKHSIRNLALKLNFKDIVSLIDAMPIYRFIHSTIDTPLLAEHLEQFQRIIKLNPDVITVQFNHGNTLLHLAARNRKADVLGLLLNAGARPNQFNDNELTPLDYAIKRGCNNGLQTLITHSSTILARENQKGRVAPLSLILRTMDYQAAAQFLNALALRTSEEIDLAFSQSLPMIETSSIKTMDALQHKLASSKQRGTFAQSLESYCESEGDTSTLFLLRLATQLRYPFSKNLLIAMQEFVITQLKVLGNAMFDFHYSLSDSQLLKLQWRIPHYFIDYNTNCMS